MLTFPVRSLCYQHREVIFCPVQAPGPRRSRAEYAPARAVPVLTEPVLAEPAKACRTFYVSTDGAVTKTRPATLARTIRAVTLAEARALAGRS